MKKRKPRPDMEAFLLMGLLYHATLQNDAVVLHNLCKDGLERAHKLYDMLKTRAAK